MSEVSKELAIELEVTGESGYSVEAVPSLVPFNTNPNNIVTEVSTQKSVTVYGRVGRNARQAGTITSYTLPTGFVADSSTNGTLVFHAGNGVSLATSSNVTINFTFDGLAFSVVVPLVPSKAGQAGVDADNTEWIYKYDASGYNGSTGQVNPSGAASGSDTNKQQDWWVPNGWYDHALAISASNTTVYASYRVKDGSTHQFGAFQTPIEWSHWGRNGQDGDGTEYVFVRTKEYVSPKPVVPTQEQSSTYCEENNNYNVDEHVPYVRVIDTYDISGSTSPVTSGGYKYVKCTDDPVGTDSTWQYEWVLKRTKEAPDATGARAWEKYSSYMSLWTNYAKSIEKTGVDELSYAVTDSDQDHPAEGSQDWKSTKEAAEAVKPWTEDKIMWTKTVVYWSDGSHTVFYSGDRNPNDGDEGTSISIASQSVMYAKRDKDHAVSDPSTLQESEWSLNYPATLNQGDWLYTRTTVNYQDSDGHSAGSTVTYGASNIGQNGNPGKGISAVTEHYITSDKNYGEAGAPVTPTDGTDWNTNPNVPDQQGHTTWNETNKYLWNYEKTTYTQGNPTRTDARVIAIWTEDGKGIDSIVNRYLTNNVSSGITKSNYKTYNNGNEWPTTITPISASAPYLWNFEVISYTDGEPTMTDPHVIGHFGADGNGIVSITRTFAISSVGTTASETTEPSHYGSWSVSSPAVTKQYPYLWAKEVTVFTDTTKNTTKYYCIGARGDNGVDAQDIEWVFIRTKTPTAPTILNDNTYTDSNSKTYTSDGHLPHVSGNANIENNQNAYECTDDPKGVTDEWLYEWEIKRTKGAASAGARAWNYYTGSMTLHNNFAESAFIIDIDNDNDQFGTDSDSKVPVQQTRSTKVTLYDGASPQTLKTLTATLKYEDSTSVPTSVATVACTKSTGVVAVTVLQNNTPNSHTEIQAHISATDTKDRQKTITFTLYKIMSGQPGLTPIIYNVEPTVKSLVFNRDASNNLTPTSRSSQINVARTEGNTTTTISSATTGLTYSWGFEDEATATNAHSGLAIGTSISVSNSDAASHSSVWVLLSTGDKETLSIVKDGAKGDSITKSSEVKAYKVSDNGTTTPTGTWYSTRAAANTAYAWTANRYMWTRTTITWSDTTTTVLYSAELKPDDGEPGMSISIASQSITYSKQTSGNVDPTTITNWGSYPSSLSKGDWLYSKTTVNYQNSQGQSAGSTNSYAVSYIGTDGSAGAAGRGITGVYEHYKASANATGETTPTSSSSEWGTNPSPSDWGASKPYLWNYERITYSKGTTTERTTASVIAVWTENGKGVDSITNFYKKSNKATGVGYPASDPDGGGTAHSGGTETGWSEAVQAADATDQYLWNYERVKWVEPNGTYSYTYTDPHVIGHFGKDGKGITLDTANSSISYAFSSYGVAGSGRSYPSDITSWSSSVPTAQQGKYLWTKDVTAYKYSDGTSAGSTTTYGVSYYATDGDSVEIDTSRTNVRYSTQKTASQPADSTFTRTTPPTLAQGDYLWCRSQTAYVGVTDALKSYSVSRVGIDGGEGDPGADGYTTHFAYATSSDGSQNFSTTNFSGATYIGTYRDQNAADSTTYTDYVWTQWKGDSITRSGNDTYRYATNNTGTRPAASSSSWSTTKPTLNKGYWLYTETTVHWSDGSTTVFYTDERNPNDGNPGMDIVAGTTTIQYKLTETNVQPTSGWGNYPSTLTQGWYLWSKATTPYYKGQVGGTSAGESVTYNVSYIAEDGDAGRSITSVSEYYKASNKSSGETAPSDDSGWSTNPNTAMQSWNQTNKYLWNYEKVTYSSGTTVERSTPAIIAIWTKDGAAGKGIDSITNYYKCTNSTTAPSRAHEGGTGWQTSPVAPDSTNQYLWNYEAITWVNPSGTTYTGVQMIGHYGKDGTSPYFADIDNEMDSIPCTYGGVTTASYDKYIYVSMWYGTATQSLTKLTYSVNGGTAYSNEQTIGNIKITPDATNKRIRFRVASGAQLAQRSDITITVACANSGDKTLHFILNGVRGGSNGTPATIFSLLPSTSSIKKNKNGTLEPASPMMCDVMKVTGNSTPTRATSSDGTLYYKVDGDITSTSTSGISTLTINTGQAAYTSSNTYITFAFFNGTTMLDKERVPIVYDGDDGVRPNILRNTKFDALDYWRSHDGSVVDGYIGYKGFQIKQSTSASFNSALQQTVYVYSGTTKRVAPSTIYTLSFWLKSSTTLAGTTSSGVYTYIYENCVDSTFNCIVDGVEQNGTPAQYGGHTWPATTSWAYHTFTFKTKSDLSSVNVDCLFGIWGKASSESSAATATICMPKIEEGDSATSYMVAEDELQGYSIALVLVRNTYTEAQWAAWAAINHADYYSKGSGDNDFLTCRIGDYFMLTGTATDSGLKHTAIYRCTAVTSSRIDGVCVSHTHDGSSPYVADLDNEMDSVACTKDGKPKSATTCETNISLFYGSSKTSFKITGITKNSSSSMGTGVTVKIDNATPSYPTSASLSHKVSVTYATTATISTKDDFAITITDADGNNSRTLHFTINGVREGASGEPAIIYSLVPTCNEVVKKKDGSYVPSGTSKIGCTVLKTTGTTTSEEPIDETDEYIAKYSLNGGSETAFPISGITVNTITSNLVILLYDKNGSILLDKETIPLVTDGTDGVDAVTIDLTNENDSMLYDSFGTLKSGNVTSEAKLFKGITPVSDSASWTITPSGCTLSSGNSRNIVVTGMTALTATVTATASYGGKTYTAVLSLKKLVNEEKYDLEISPSAISYNTTTSSPSSVSITAKIWKTSVDGTRALSAPPTDYRLYARANNGSGSILSWTDTNTLSLSVNPNSYSAVFVILEKISGEQIILDSETIPITKTQNGAAGKNAIHLALDNEHEDFIYSASGKVAPTSITSRAHLYNGPTEVTSGITWAIDQNQSSTSGISYSDVTFTNGLLTVNGITADTAKITVQATYNSNVYKAVFTSNKTSQDKYDLILTPSSIAYNPASYTTQTITASARGTSILGTDITATISTTANSGNLRLFWAYVSNNGTVGNKSRKVGTTLSVTASECASYAGLYVELRWYDSTSTSDTSTTGWRVCDYETVEIAKSENGEEGKGYKAVVNRDGSFTESQWESTSDGYGKIGHVDTWGNTSSTRGDCKTGDWFIVVGKSSDTGDYHTATYECDNDSGDLHGKCIAHQVTQNAFEFNVTPSVMQWSTNSSGTLTNWSGQSGTATAYKGSKSLTPSSLSITNLPLGFVPTFSSSGGFTITPVQNYTSFYNSSGSPTTIYVMKAQNGGIASGDKVYNSSMVVQSGTITSVTSSTGYATAVVWNSKTYSYSSAASTSLANPVNAIVSCTAAGATRTLSVTISPAKQGAQGIQGIQGKMGRNPYFWGVWSEKGSSETFTVTDYMTAYVQTNEPWAEIPTCYMFVGANGTYTKTSAGTPSSTSTNWKLMTSDFEYIITKAIFSGFAKLGSGIFNEDYAFSQYGIRNGSRSKRYEYFMPNGGVMTGSLAGTTPSNPVVLGTFSAAATSYSFNIEFDVASSANYAGITTNPTGTWAYSWNENSTSYTKTASSLTVGQKYYVVAGRAQGTATKAKVTCTTNVFTPNLYIDWLNGEIYSQLGRFVNVTIEGVLNNLSINITESNYSNYGSRSGSGQPFWLDPTKVGNIVTYRCNSPLGLPSAWYEGGPDVYNISSGGVSITLDQLRQCIGKKIYLYTFSNTSMQSFYCGINGNGMFVYETDHKTLNQITSDTTETVKYNRVYQYASQQSMNNSFFIFECKLGEYNNHECIYWGITRSAYRMDYDAS